MSDAGLGFPAGSGELVSRPVSGLTMDLMRIVTAVGLHRQYRVLCIASCTLANPRSIDRAAERRIHASSNLHCCCESPLSFESTLCPSQEVSRLLWSPPSQIWRGYP